MYANLARNKLVFFIAFYVLSTVGGTSSAQTLNDTGDYFGQTPPGSKPLVFAPGIISKPQSDDIGYYSPDMQSFYVTRAVADEGKGAIRSVFERKGNSWESVNLSSLNNQVVYAPDGKTRYVGANFQHRTDIGWSELQTLGSAFEDMQIVNISVSSTGTLILEHLSYEEGGDTLSFSNIKDGIRQLPQPLPRGVNAGQRNANPYISPDESYMLWDGVRRSGFGESDIYVSFKQADGTWSEAFNLGSTINTAGAESRPKVSPDGKYLFFNKMVVSPHDKGKQQLDLFWVDASVIENLRLRNNDNISPKATPKEAPIVYWSVPSIKRHFFQLPRLAQPYITTEPVDLNDGLAVGELGIDGGDTEKLIETISEIAKDPKNEIDSLLVIKNDKLIFESYFARGRIDLSHPQSSAVKSYTSMVLGRAVQMGYLNIQDLDKPIANFFTELKPAEFAPGVEKITLRRVLSMRSGLRIDDETTQMLHNNPHMIAGQKEVQELFERTEPIDALKEEVFSYGNFSSHLAMQVLNAVVPGGAEKFIREEFLGKLSITNYAWQLGPAGLPEGGWRMSMTSRDMAKIGLIALNEGKWNGKQFISEAYLEEALSRQLSLSEEQVERFYTGKNLSNAGYGFFWWLMDMQIGDQQKFIRSKSVQGGGGMTIQVFDELDLVIVITAHSPFSYSQFIGEKILPAFIEN